MYAMQVLDEHFGEQQARMPPVRRVRLRLRGKQPVWPRAREPGAYGYSVVQACRRILRGELPDGAAPAPSAGP